MVAIPPSCFRLPWSGRDLDNMDDMYYEPEPDELNDRYCKGCERVFWVTPECSNHNRFARCFNGKDSKQILWDSLCTICEARRVGNQNVTWPQLNGSFIAWRETFAWDMVIIVVAPLPKEARHHVALSVFRFLGQGHNAFPAQCSHSLQEERAETRRDTLRWQRYENENGGRQRGMLEYFQKVPASKKPKTVDPHMQTYWDNQAKKQARNYKMRILLKQTTQTPT